ncbi:MAG: biotin transporter BioY, partial [Mesorhizobium sp.]|nr:biotin transporter BioY [Mesorhizobium sp.]
MSNAIALRPLASLALPREGNARIAGQVALVVAGSLLLTVASKVTVPFWPVPMTLQTLAVFLIAAAYG